MSVSGAEAKLLKTAAQLLDATTLLHELLDVAKQLKGERDEAREKLEAVRKVAEGWNFGEASKLKEILSILSAPDSGAGERCGREWTASKLMHTHVCRSPEGHSGMCYCGVANCTSRSVGPVAASSGSEAASTELTDLRTIFQALRFDCGDNSCRFARGKGGMRTNGGCRCTENLFGFKSVIAGREVVEACLRLRGSGVVSPGSEGKARVSCWRHVNCPADCVHTCHTTAQPTAPAKGGATGYMDTLPRCIHGACLVDGGGERLEPPCGCRAPSAQPGGEGEGA